jgi:hypothetical protein
MIEAEIKGKVPEVQNKEDILTSNVFGLLKYLNQRDLILQILYQARTLSGKSFLDSVDFSLEKYIPKFYFWKQIVGYGEPDLIIKFEKEDDSALLLCIEVKYYSSKSGEGDDDQLLRYFRGMTKFANLSESNFLGVIYLTKYPSRKEIAESLNHIQNKGDIAAEDKLFQLKWTQITEAIESYDKRQLGTVEKMILKDLINYLKYKNLIGFSKFSFQSEAFNIKPDHYYEATKFRGFTFLRNVFDIRFNNKIFYG